MQIPLVIEPAKWTMRCDRPTTWSVLIQSFEFVSCDCCGSGCGEVKCPVVIIDGNFDDYVQHKNSCLEKVNGNLQLKESHSYYYQVQQQLFSVPDLQYDDFVVYAIDKAKNTHLFVQRIYPDVQHWNSVLPKLETFWRICILPEILGRWYTRRCTVPPTLPSKDAICFCRTERDEDSILCSNKDCPYQRFHPSCLSLSPPLQCQRPGTALTVADCLSSRGKGIPENPQDLLLCQIMQ